MLTEEEAEEKFEDTDENKDGRVSWEEHVIETYGTTDPDEILRNDDNNKVN
jgi:hypothetical protein